MGKEFNNIDDKIKEFVVSWEKCEFETTESTIKKSLTLIIISEIYDYFRISILGDTLNYFKKRKLNRFRYYSEIIKHSIWYIPFFFKWLFLFHFIKNKDYIVLSLLPDKEHNIKYIRKLTKTKDRANVILVHFGMFYNWELLFQKNFFCYPHFFYRFLVKKKDFQNFRQTINNDLPWEIREAFGVEISIKIEQNMAHIERIFSSFEHLLKLLKNKGRILFFLQDLDFITNGFIYNYISKLHLIKTISVDHSILLPTHYFINRTSDYYFVWGEYQKKRLEIVSQLNPETIKIIGHPKKVFKEKENDGNNINWLYLMQSYQYPITQSINRTPGATIEKLSRLRNILYKLNPEAKLLVKQHPLEKYVPSDFDNHLLVNKKLDSVLPKIGMVFFEDTSAVIECLAYPIQLIFLADSINSKHIFDFTNLFNTIYKEDDWDEKIKSFRKNPIDMKEKESLFEYFYGKSSVVNQSFLQSVEEIIS